jgi:hypothetical protein
MAVKGVDVFASGMKYNKFCLCIVDGHYTVDLCLVDLGLLDCVQIKLKSDRLDHKPGHPHEHFSK